VAVPWPSARGKQVTGVLALAPARREMPSRGLRLLVRCLVPWHGAVRGLSVEAPAGRPFSLWGKVFDVTILIFLCLQRFGLSHTRSSFLRLKRTLEQAQPSMAKRLKAGAASKESG